MQQRFDEQFVDVLPQIMEEIVEECKICPHEQDVDVPVPPVDAWTKFPRRLSCVCELARQMDGKARGSCASFSSVVSSVHQNLKV